MSYPINPEIHKFLERLLEEAHQADLPAELKEEMYADLNGRLQNHIMTTYYQEMSAPTVAEFDKFLDTEPTQEAIQEWLVKNVPEISEISARALLEFKDIYLGAMKK